VPKKGKTRAREVEEKEGKSCRGKEEGHRGEVTGASKNVGRNILIIGPPGEQSRNEGQKDGERLIKVKKKTKKGSRARRRERGEVLKERDLLQPECEKGKK